jgi:hypothetical protein
MGTAVVSLTIGTNPFCRLRVAGAFGAARAAATTCDRRDLREVALAHVDPYLAKATVASKQEGRP